MQVRPGGWVREEEAFPRSGEQPGKFDDGAL